MSNANQHASNLAPSTIAPKVVPFVARWDLDKTYLRTDFDTLADLLATAFERPDQKRTVPGAGALMRALNDVGAAIHILSGSPEQLRGRIVDKLQLDGVRFESLTLKPNLQNILRLRFKAVRGQLGYKLCALLRRRCELPTLRNSDSNLLREVLLGDDAEADAFVYSLFADICAGRVDDATLAAVMTQGGCYDDEVEDALRFSSYIDVGETVDRILIHLERQSSPRRFDHLGRRVVPFYNYAQAAFVLLEDGKLDAAGALYVAQDLATRDHFDGESLARSYFDLARRGHVSGKGVAALEAELSNWLAEGRFAGESALTELVRRLRTQAGEIPPVPVIIQEDLDYVSLAAKHNRRRH